MRVVGPLSTAGVALAMGTLLTGCTFPGQKSSKPTAIYVLEGEPTSESTSGTSISPCLTLSVAIPRSAPGFATSRIAYVEKPYRIDYFAYHEWADTPARMLQSALEQRLEASGMFRAVVTASVPVQADLRLETDLLRLQQEFMSPQSQVHLEVRFSLHDVTAHRLLFSETFSLQEPAEHKNPYAGVLAANRAVEQLLAALLNKIEEPVRQKGCTQAAGIAEE